MKLLLLTQLLVVATLARAKEAGSLHIVAPAVLRDQFQPDGEIKMSPAKFGIPAYAGREVQGLAVYAPKGDMDACEPIDKALIPNWPEKKPVVLMVDRGTCTFVTKVRQAEETGAAAVIIVDNKDERYLPYMADDNTGANIQIPSMLIHKDDGAKVKAYIDSEAENDLPVMLSLAWDYAPVDNVVEWELYSTVANREAAEFKLSFADAVDVLGKDSTFTPHIFTIKMNYCATAFKDPTSPRYQACRDSCIRGGRYCANGDVDTGTKGYKILQADVTGNCVWQVVNKTNDYSAYFTYSAQMTLNCMREKLEATCSEQLMLGLGIDTDAVEECVAATGGIDQETDEANTMLDAEILEKADKNVYYEPDAHVNGFRYSGTFSCPSPIDRSHCGMLASICASYKDPETIKACVSDADCPLGQVKDMAGTCGGNCSYDKCNRCLEVDDAKINKCLGCDGEPFSGKVVSCGRCGGPQKDKCGRCYNVTDSRRIDANSNTSCAPKGNASAATEPQIIRKKGEKQGGGFSAGAIVGIVMSCVAVVGLGVFCFMKHRQRQLKEDIDALLKQYLPMDAQPGASASHQVAVI